MRAAALIAIALAPAMARADEAEFPDVIGANVTATSKLVTKQKTYEPWSVLASDDTSFWCEGKPDEGIGEALTIHLAAPTKIDSIAISAGVQRSPELFRANNLVTGLDVVTDDGRTFHVAPPEEMKSIGVAIGGAPVNKLVFTLTRVKRGKMNDSCISHIALATAPPSVVAIGVDRAHAAAKMPELSELRSALPSCDAHAFARLLAFPFHHRWRSDDGSRHEAAYKTASAAARACKSPRDGESFDLLTVGSEPDLVAARPGELLVRFPQIRWRMKLDGDRWKLASAEWEGQ